MTALIWPRDDTEVLSVEEIEDYHSAPRPPIACLSDEPPPYANILVNGPPVAIAEKNHLDQTSDMGDSTLAQAIATILRHWHPNALRAFLDCKTYSSFDFDICDKHSNGKIWRTYSIWRRERNIRFEISDQNGVWHLDCRYGMLDGRPWMPLGAGSIELGRSSTPAWVERLASSWDMEQMLRQNRKHRNSRSLRFLLNDMSVDPISLY